MIKATYQGVSYHEAFTNVNITVKRNEREPQFKSGNYRREILEYFPLGDSIVQVVATDSDKNVSLPTILILLLRVNKKWEKSISMGFIFYSFYITNTTGLSECHSTMYHHINIHSY